MGVGCEAAGSAALARAEGANAAAARTESANTKMALITQSSSAPRALTDAQRSEPTEERKQKLSDLDLLDFALTCLLNGVRLWHLPMSSRTPHRECGARLVRHCLDVGFPEAPGLLVGGVAEVEAMSREPIEPQPQGYTGSLPTPTR